MSQTSLVSQDINMINYNGDWVTDIHPQALSHTIEFNQVSNLEWNVKMSNDHPFYNKNIRSRSFDKIHLILGDELSFQGKVSADQNTIEGFLNTNTVKHRLTLVKGANGGYQCKWNSFYVDELNPARLFMVIENGIGSNFECYPILPDNRYRGTYTVDFQLQQDVISFFDKNGSYFF